MIFSELYSAYYRAVSDILTAMLNGAVKEKDLQKIVADRAFGESVLTILPSLKNGRWQLVRSDMTAVLTHKPTMPLTTLQKQWLKAISLDPRIRLFGVEWEGLADVEPLFTPDDYCVYDQYSDGDPFEDRAYIRRFQFLLSAIRERMPIKIAVINRNGKSVYTKCVPLRLEYSEKDDKFRLIIGGCRFMHVVNLSKITVCAPYHGGHEISGSCWETQYESATLEITDERNALERVMLHFAHFEKQTEKLGKNRYVMRIRYDRNDESEIVIRVLSFGPLVRVTESPRLVTLIKEKLLRQKDCELT